MLGLENMFTAGSFQGLINQIVGLLSVLGLFYLLTKLFLNRGSIMRAENTRETFKHTKNIGKGLPEKADNREALLVEKRFVEEAKQGKDYRTKAHAIEKSVPKNKLGKKQKKLIKKHEAAAERQYDLEEDFMLEEITQIDRQTNLGNIIHTTATEISKLGVLKKISDLCDEVNASMLKMDEASLDHKEKQKQELHNLIHDYKNVVKDMYQMTQKVVKPQQEIEKTQRRITRALWVDIKRKRKADSALAASGTSYATYLIGRFAVSMGKDKQAMIDANKLKNAAAKIAQELLRTVPKRWTYSAFIKNLKRNSKHKTYEPKFTKNKELYEFNDQFNEVLQLIDSIIEFINREIKINEDFLIILHENNKFQKYLENINEPTQTISAITHLPTYQFEHQEKIAKLSEYTENIQKIKTEACKNFINTLKEKKEVIRAYQNKIINVFTTLEGGTRREKVDPKVTDNKLAA